MINPAGTLRGILAVCRQGFLTNRNAPGTLPNPRNRSSTSSNRLRAASAKLTSVESSLMDKLCATGHFEEAAILHFGQRYRYLVGVRSVCARTDTRRVSVSNEF